MTLFLMQKKPTCPNVFRIGENMQKLWLKRKSNLKQFIEKDATKMVTKNTNKFWQLQFFWTDRDETFVM